MRTNNSNAIRVLALRAATILSFAAVAALGQQQINLTAGPSTTTLPDGSAVPMWGYSCGAVVTGSTATCAALAPVTTGWSPVVITVPSGQDLTVNLTNNLTFGANNVPTSMVIVGQLGGGLGDVAQRTTTAAPDHSNAQAATTWPIAGGAGATPPAQGPRVQSFSTEVAAGATAALTWKAPRPGTYLIESGTHPSIQGPMGLYGILVVTTAPSGATAGTAYPAAGTTAAVTYNAEIPLLLSEIDPVQNSAVSTAVSTAGFKETMVWSGQPGGCGNPSSPTYHQCYPPAVNYTPLYYLFNGVAFNKTNAAASVFATSPASGVTGTVLVRLVNAGLRMHVPSIVGAQTGANGLPGFYLIAEDGSPLPGNPRIQSEVFLAAGKTYDVMINVPAAGGSALPIFDRQLSLSGNSTARDTGMLAYIGVNGTGAPAAPAFAAAVARPDSYGAVVGGQTVTVSDPSKGVIANDTNVYGVQLLAAPTGGTITLNPNGTFTYVANSGTTSDSFKYCANGTVTAGVCSSGISATVTLGAAPVEAATGITVNNITYTATTGTFLSIKRPGVLSVDTDAAGYPLTIAASTVVPGSNLSLTVDPNGGFNATVGAAGTYTFTYKAQNSQGTLSSNSATVTLVFPPPTNLAVTVLDPNTKAAISDYRWIIEEDRTFYVNPGCTTNPPAAGCPTFGQGYVPTFGTNFHTSYMPLVATGCTGPTSCESGQSQAGQPVVCDVGNGACRPDTTGNGLTPTLPSSVHLDPTKHYYISVLPGDAADPFETANAGPGHGMGGAPVACVPVKPAVTCDATGTFPPVTILTQATPFPPSKLSVFVFEDDFPLNGEQDGGGGIDVLSPNEPGLGGFNITLFDDAGGPGDPTGQMTYDMFNQPLANSLSGTLDPATGLDACPVSAHARASTTDPTQTGITGTIVTCPKYESDGKTLSPLAGQAVVANLMPGRYGVVATPAADRIARGEEWLQTNTLDGQKAHDSFLRIGEPSFFQEFGPAGFHVSIGFANPKIINDRKAGVCNGSDPNITGPNCTNVVTGRITTERMSRTPDERLYGSGSNDSFAYTQCYVSLGDPDGEDFAFTKCDGSGRFSLSGLPDGDWRITVFDQWNDMLVDGLSTPVRISGGQTLNVGDLAINQWQSNIYTKTFFDMNGNGIQDANETGLSLVPTNIRFRDGSFSNFNNTDLSGNAGFNEVFPLFSWYVVETDSTRYKPTGTHVVYDAGGPADGTTGCGTGGLPPCGSSTIAANLANTAETVSLPTALRVPGARYCASADCPAGDTAGGSTGRVDPPSITTYGWQGFSGQNNFLEFGKKPYAPGETGGIHGHVVYASTRPFDDPSLLLQLSWEPLVPNVTVNLYQEGTAPDGVTTTLKLVDTTKTSSWDDWAQGFRSDGVPNMNCPGQTTADMFYFTLFNQPMYLDAYNNGPGAAKALPNNSQFKCYDGMHNWNQLQPAPYDGMYKFPSVTAWNPTTGKPAGTNCSICAANHAAATTDWDYGLPMLPAGKYVVEVVVPPGYELVKEEDKNILIGDNYIAPVTQEFPNLGTAIFIMPDQAAAGTLYNANNAQNPTTDLGHAHLPQGEGDTGQIEQYWPCVGQARVVPDYISLFPGSAEVAPFAGATRNLCDRKEVTLQEQMSALAKFYIFTSTHAAAHFTGVITDDFTSEFDPFSPQFGEKFSPANLPVSIKDWTGTEISRVYTDQWGSYNGMTYSTWEVNPPNPTGYAPTMMVTCMNDPGSGPTPDPLYNPAYSNFCYEIPFMPGQTQYMDTPVTPTSAFAGAGYNNPDCNYPDATPAISEVDGDGVGPWVAATGTSHPITIHALGDQTITNYAYSGPSATTAPYNQKTITRHYGFGATPGTVTIGGAAANIVSWSDLQIVVTAPTTGVPTCTMQQQAQYGGSNAQCGQLVVTAANNQQSIDAITVTFGGKPPTHVPASGSIQTAIDAAMPGDMLMIDPTCTSAGATVPCTTAGATRSANSHNEMLLMWKPLRLQGVGAASSIINANTHPAGKLDNWRRQVNCLFGLAIDGTPFTAATGSNPYDPSGTYACGSTNGAAWTAFNGRQNFPQVDRLPLEATVGWDASLNGNLAELLQEPSLMGALEGAAITVLSKGVDFHGANPFDSTLFAGFPTGTTLLTSTNCGRGAPGSASFVANPFPSDFQCNPSRIDGLGITNSSQGGGGIFVHGWGHNLEIANNRVYNNSGTLSGGINVGQGEYPPSYIQGSATNAPPGSCQASSVANVQLPYCHDLNVNVHNNAIMLNSSTGDELFSATPAGAGAISFCTGSDYYKFRNNWVCGNLSTGDGGGFGHIGFSYFGDIEYNKFLFNQSTNPTIASNGGGVLVMGAPDVDPPCGTTTDADCVAAPGSVSPSDGVGPGLVINGNLIMGNSAESGSGGGIRLQNINGGDVVSFPTTPAQWYSVSVTNNIIANNVAGWDGAGISLQDALAVSIINNTIVSNDTTASSGVLFNTLGAPLASSSGPCPGNLNPSPSNPCVTGSTPQPAGLVSIQNSAILTANLPATVVCPAGHGAGGTGTGGLTNGKCRGYSVPVIDNDVFWQNRAFYIAVGSLGAGPLNQQNVVALFNAFSGTSVSSEPTADATAANGSGAVITGGAGACVPGTSYWDIGVRGDTGPSNHGSGLTLAPVYSVLTDATDYPSANNIAANPTFVSQYCNGSRTPPEFKSLGYQVPPGISDATVPNPVFSLQPSATVDEGNNWINISWGPLTAVHPLTGTPLGNYVLATGSPAIDAIPTTASTFSVTPHTDFFGNPRPDPASPNRFDVGAVEYQAAAGAATLTVTGGPLAFGNVAVGTASAAQTLTLSNTGAVAANGIALTFAPARYARAAAGGTCGATLAGGANCTINVVFAPTATGLVSGTLAIASTNATVTGSPVTLSGTGVAMLVTPASLAFGNVPTATISAPQTLTLRNGSGATRTLTITITAPFARAGAAGTCGATLANNTTCTINVVFSPTTVGSATGTVTIAAAGSAVTNSPVPLTGAGVARVVAGTLTPTTWTPTQTRNCPGTTPAQILACTLDTAQAFTLTNTGNVPLTGIAQGVLGGANTADFSVARLLSTCGPASGGQLAGLVTLNPGATCTITVQFKPLTSEAAGTKSATISVTDAAGTQTSTLTGTAN